jgi:[ribosomal protein S5]-alanine N-acetyltransferase
MQYSEMPNLPHALVNFVALTRADAVAWYNDLSLPEVFEHTSWNLQSAQDLAEQFDSYESASPASQVRLILGHPLPQPQNGTLAIHCLPM